jgi:hypothetical protein
LLELVTKISIRQFSFGNAATNAGFKIQRKSEGLFVYGEDTALTCQRTTRSRNLTKIENLPTETKQTALDRTAPNNKACLLNGQKACLLKRK